MARASVPNRGPSGKFTQNYFTAVRISHEIRCILLPWHHKAPTGPGTMGACTSELCTIILGSKSEWGIDIDPIDMDDTIHRQLQPSNCKAQA